jgi:hypothetical protein
MSARARSSASRLDDGPGDDHRHALAVDEELVDHAAHRILSIQFRHGLARRLAHATSIGTYARRLELTVTSVTTSQQVRPACSGRDRTRWAHRGLTGFHGDRTGRLPRPGEPNGTRAAWSPRAVGVGPVARPAARPTAVIRDVRAEACARSCPRKDHLGHADAASFCTAPRWADDGNWSRYLTAAVAR